VGVSVDAISIASTVPGREKSRDSRSDPTVPVADLLLGVTARRSFVRPFVRADAAGTTVGFGINLGAEPSAVELAHALGALASAHDACAPELAALLTTDLASRLASLNP
jgi:hypothetical protein